MSPLKHRLSPVCLRTRDDWRHIFFFLTLSPASLSLPPQLAMADLVRGPAPIGKGEGPRGSEVPGLCGTPFPLHSSECTQSSNLVGRDMLCDGTLASIFFFSPFGTLIMSCGDGVDQKRSGCSRPATGLAPPRVPRRCAAPCPASPLFPNRRSPPASVFETSGSPGAVPACVFCLYYLPSCDPARCRRKRRGTLCARCIES